MSPRRSSKFCIIGAGRVGTAIGVTLRRAGFDVVGVASRRVRDASRLARKVDCTRATRHPGEVVEDAEIVFITTPDDEIAGVCRQIADCVRSGTLVIHTSGALSSAVLSPAKTRGAVCLSMHPCQSFSDIESPPERLVGCHFCLEGNPSAVKRGRQLARRMNCQSFVLKSEEKLLYHIACSISSNYFVVLIDLAVSILAGIGMRRDDSLKVIVPLIRGTLQNVTDFGSTTALTGPIEREETELLSRELEAINSRLPELRGVYTTLGKEAIRIAAQKGKLSSAASRRLSKILDQA
jgi:predicted short-subunit dehydrogenase-like oxidoreductase (DUF2520 family)